MRKNFSIIGFLLLALLNAGAGNVIAASFCPRFTANHACCQRHSGAADKQPDNMFGSSCHVHAHEMNHEQSARPLPFETVSSSEEPECTHCLSHSQTSPVRSMAAPAASVQDIAQTGPTLHPFEDHFSFLHLLTFDHGPPGNVRSRHILISVFRI
jgi:hypothetical protein